MDKLGLAKTHIKTVYDCPSYLTEYEKSIIHYSMAYSYLLPCGSFDYNTLADYIDRYYDTKQCPQNREVVSVLRRVH